MTNYEKIKLMPPDDIAFYLRDIIECCTSEIDHCRDCPLLNCWPCSEEAIKKWLESEVSENERS